MTKCKKLKIDKIKAMLIIAQSKHSNNHKRCEKRYYWCTECQAYHTTSKK